MKRTGPTKEKTKKAIALLEKTGRKSKSAIWIDLAQRLSKSRRQRTSVNLWKIEKLAKLFQGKNLVVAGKVLGNGQLTEKANIIAFEFSEEAERKIKEAGGKAISIEESTKIAPKEMVLIK